MKAMLLAAGKGKRMLPLTQSTPKPLLTIDGEPMIVRHIKHLVADGITDIVINVHYLADTLMQALGDGSQWGARITFSDERLCKGALETGGGIIHALPLLGEDPFILVAADIVTDFPFGSLKNHFNTEKLGHLVLVDTPPFHPEGDYGLKYGIVDLNASKKYNFAGICVLHPKMLSELPPQEMRLSSLFRPHIEAGHLSGEHYPGMWQNIGTPELLANAQQH